MLINPGLGCRILLGEIVTTLAIEADEPFVGDCGECDKCIRACPTGALQCDGNLDASRCINYLTIEHKGEIARELACKIGGRLFGCEECILVCPYQKSAPSCSNRQFRLYPDREKIDPNEILSMDEESFAARFAGSAIGHTGLDSLKRNARICLANIREGHI